MSESNNAANAGGRPPYKCARTPNPDVCLKFYWNEVEQRYNLPPGGERVNCGECGYFFDS